MGIERKLHNLLHPKIGEIWMLHRLVEEPSPDPLAVSVIWLEALIEQRRSQGARFIPIGQVDKGRNWISITFDDGYHDTLSLGLPLFQRLNIPFTVYVTTGFIDNRQPMPWYTERRLSLTSIELCELFASPLCTIGAHTVNHPRLSKLSIKEQQMEIQDSIYEIEAITGCAPVHFAYPHGDYNSDTVAICRSLGLHTAVTTSGCPIRTDSNPLMLDRINIIQR